MAFKALMVNRNAALEAEAIKALNEIGIEKIKGISKEEENALRQSQLE